MTTVVTVTLKGEDATFRQKFLHYDSDGELAFTATNEPLRRMIEEACTATTSPIDEVWVTARFQWSA
jgi:hypothetical protein